MKKYLFPILIILAIIFSFGCEKAQEKIKGFVGDEKKLPTKTIVVLVDLTRSTMRFRNNYEEYISKILPTVNHGDVFLVAKITASSVTEPDVPIKAEFPEFVPVDKFNRPVDNDLMVRNLRKDADSLLQSKKSELELKIKDKKGFLYKDDRIMNTDIMSSLSLAEKVFISYKRDKSVLVILSDMIEDSGPYNFEKIKLSKEKTAGIIEKAKRDNRIPNLANVKVYVVAAGSESSNKFGDIQNFWEKYFNEAHANFSTANYSNTLLNFKE